MLNLFVYDHQSLRPVVEQVLGTHALQWWDRKYVPCVEAPQACSSFDAEYADGRLHRELPLALRSHARFVSSPEEADGVLWLVWDYSLCIASGMQPEAWERGKQIVTASCAAHIALLSWLQSTPRWRRSEGKDFTFMVDDPNRWQNALGSQSVHEAALTYYMQIGRAHYGGAGGEASIREMYTASATLATVTRNSVLISTEDRRLPHTQGSSHVIIMPYYADASMYRTIRATASELRHRPYVASFAGSIGIPGHDCPNCENGFDPWDIRRKLAFELRYHCGSEGRNATTVPSNATAAPSECSMTVLDSLNVHRDDRSGMASAGVDFARILGDSRFCPIPRGDSASTKRFYAAVLAGCVPVVISDHFVPAFRQLGSEQAMLRIPEAAFLTGRLPSRTATNLEANVFAANSRVANSSRTNGRSPRSLAGKLVASGQEGLALIPFLRSIENSGRLDEVLARGHALRHAFSFEHVRDWTASGPSEGHEADAVDYIASELLTVLVAVRNELARREPPEANQLLAGDCRRKCPPARWGTRDDSCPTAYTVPDRLLTFVLIPSAVRSVGARDAMRRAWLWNATNADWDYGFFVGAAGTHSSTGNQAAKRQMLQQLTNMSSVTTRTSMFGDLVQLVGVPDDYLHLSWKVLGGLQWAYRNVRSAFVLKVDTDTWVEPLHLVNFLKHNLEASAPLYGGLITRAAPVARTGLWAVPYAEYSSGAYEPYATGGGYILSQAAILPVLTAVRDGSPLIANVEDATIGIAASASGIAPTPMPGFRDFAEPSELDCCEGGTILYHKPADMELCGLCSRKSLPWRVLADSLQSARRRLFGQAPSLSLRSPSLRSPPPPSRSPGVGVGSPSAPVASPATGTMASFTTSYSSSSLEIQGYTPCAAGS